jgi:hypothetical protein
MDIRNACQSKGSGNIKNIGGINISTVNTYGLDDQGSILRERKKPPVCHHVQ